MGKYESLLRYVRWLADRTIAHLGRLQSITMAANTLAADSAAAAGDNKC